MQLSAAKRKYKTLNSTAGNEAGADVDAHDDDDDDAGGDGTGDGEENGDGNGDSLKLYNVTCQRCLKPNQNTYSQTHTHTHLHPFTTLPTPTEPAFAQRQQQFDGTVRHSDCRTDEQTDTAAYRQTNKNKPATATVLEAGEKS